jgi:hypothetical protein
MIVERGMNLGQLLYIMDPDATYADAEAMRVLLVRDYCGHDTGTIPKHAWAALAGEAMPVVDCAAIERKQA